MSLWKNPSRQNAPSENSSRRRLEDPREEILGLSSQSQVLCRDGTTLGQQQWQQPTRRGHVPDSIVVDDVSGLGHVSALLQQQQWHEQLRQQPLSCQQRRFGSSTSQAHQRMRCSRGMKVSRWVNMPICYRRWCKIVMEFLDKKFFGHFELIFWPRTEFFGHFLELSFSILFKK